MNKTDRRRVSGPLIWAALLIAVAVPITAAAFSPLLAWREPIYIIAGFAGILGMGLLLFQPILAGGYIPELSTRSHRRLHRWVGSTLVLAVVGVDTRVDNFIVVTYHCSQRKRDAL